MENISVGDNLLIPEVGKELCKNSASLIPHESFIEGSYVVSNEQPEEYTFVTEVFINEEPFILISEDSGNGNMKVIEIRGV